MYIVACMSCASVWPCQQCSFSLHRHTALYGWQSQHTGQYVVVVVVVVVVGVVVVVLVVVVVVVVGKVTVEPLILATLNFGVW